MAGLPRTVEAEMLPMWPLSEPHHINTLNLTADGSSATVPRTPDGSGYRSVPGTSGNPPAFEIRPIAARPPNSPLQQSAPYTPNSFILQYPGSSHQLTSEPAKPRWQWSEVDERERALAHDYLETAASQLDRGELSIVPGIPKTYLFDFEKDICCFRPNDILLLRHLDRVARHQQFTEFISLGRLMRDTDPGKEVYWDAWSLMVEATERLRKKEHDFYIQFAEKPDQTEEQMTAHANDWMKLTAYQANTTNFDRATGMRSVVSVTDKKRSRSEEDKAQCPSNPKKAKVDDKSTATSLKEQPPLPELIFKTPARDQLLRHKTGEDAGGRPKYNAEHAWAGTGACSKHPWIAWADEVEMQVQAKDVFLYPDDNGLRPLSVEENKNLPIWKRCYQSDLVSLPQYPEQDPNAYSRHADGSFRCLHTDYNCVDGTCRQKNHECCKTGYKTVSQLKTAIRRAVRTWRSQVEALIDDEKLDERHKSWTGWCNARLNRIKKKEAEEAKEKADQAVAEVFSYDAPYTAAVTFSLDTLTSEELHDQEQHRQQELDATLRRHNGKENKVRSSYQKTRMYPNWDHSNAWWGAVKREQCGELLYEEEKKLRQQANPQYVPDVPLVVEDVREEDFFASATAGMLSEQDDGDVEGSEFVTEEILRGFFE
jgi:hypothetical protein